MPEVRLAMEARDYYTQTPPKYHVTFEGEGGSLCGAVEGVKLSRGYGDPKEGALCKACVAKATLRAVALVAEAHDVEFIIGKLREDVQSLFTHGPVSRAIGKLSQAASELMDEARERALSEVQAAHPVVAKRRLVKA